MEIATFRYLLLCQTSASWCQRWANYTAVCNWITNYQLQCFRV